jgi:hypothetical protein
MAVPLRALVKRWVEAGLIRPDQAGAILAAEDEGLLVDGPAAGSQAGAGAGEPARGAAGAATASAAAALRGAGGRAGVLALVAEALGYVGAALALVAAFLIAERFWADLRPWARVLLPAVAAGALFAAGAFVRERRASPAARLGGFLWFLSAGACALTLGLAGDELLGFDGDSSALLAGVGTAIFAGGLWAARRQALQQIALFASIMTTVTSGLAVAELMDWTGLALWGLGVAWLALAWGGLLLPERTGYALGALAALLGPRLLGPLGPGSGRAWLLLGLATAMAFVAASVRMRRTLLLGMGVAGLFLYVPMLVFEYFSGALGAPLALVVTGVVLVGVALVLARLTRPPSASPIAPGDPRGA